MPILPESTILTPRDPKLEDDNDWEQFQLTNVEVRNTTTNELSSVLLADANNPLYITGRLKNVEPEQAHLLLQNTYSKSPTIQIDHVTQFAYGEYDDHEIVIWIAGKAGWFKIEPSRSYKAIFADMLQAVGVLYYLADYYRDGVAKGKGGTKGFEELCESYANDFGASYNSASDAAELFHKYRDFLLLSMIKNAEGLQWSKVPLYIYLKKNFPESFNAVFTRMQGSGDGSAPPRQSTSQSLKLLTLDTLSLTSSSTGSRRRGRPRKYSTAQHNVSTPESSESRDMPSASGSNPVQKRRRGRPRKGSENISQSEDSLLAPSENIEMNSSEDEPVPKVGRTFTSKGRGEGKGKGKSALRPRTTRISAKGTKNYYADPFDPDAIDEVDEFPDDNDAASPSKRRSPVSRNGQIGDYPNKRPNNSASPDPKRRSTITTLKLPLHWRPPQEHDRTSATQSSSFIPKITSTPIPELKPNGPGNSWGCTVDGCMHRVYGADSEVGRTLIREHYTGHMEEKQAQIDLIMSEQRPHLPVNNLLKRIREIAERQRTATPPQQTPQMIASLAMRSAALIERSY